jgi:hypothetical protein
MWQSKLTREQTQALAGLLLLATLGAMAQPVPLPPVGQIAFALLTAPSASATAGQVMSLLP